MFLEGVNLAAKTANIIKKDPDLVEVLAQDILDNMVDELILGFCFDVHKSVKTGSWEVTQLNCPEYPPMLIAGHVDVFGLPVTTLTGLPSLKHVPQIACPNCERTLAASRFAPHLEKCMGMGRNSSRVASRRLAAGNKDSYREGGHDDDDDDDDEWVEPGKKDKPRKRDKNSPRRHKSNIKLKEGQDGMITPPQSYDQLSLEERRKLLTTLCGVLINGSKLCTRSIKCPTHSDQQRREVRLKWLVSKPSDNDDVDLNSDDDTSALRDSMSQLSNASSPAESTVSTSSNPGHVSREGSGGRSSKNKDKSKRGKKGKQSSKNSSSRGSTPPYME